jgi:CubicO group peptidase (beta-lactamase class C family)
MKPKLHSSCRSLTSGDEWMQGISALPLIQSPDEGYYYGLNTTVLGFVMERATGKSLQMLLEERVLDPYDIEGLTFLLPESAVLPPRVSGIDGAASSGHGHGARYFWGSPTALRQ